MPLTTRRWRLSIVLITALALGGSMLASHDDRGAGGEWFTSRGAASYRLRRSIAQALQREGSVALREALHAATTGGASQSAPRSTTAPSLTVVSMDSIADRYLGTLAPVVEREFAAIGFRPDSAGIAPRARTQVLLIGDLPSSLPLRFAPATRDASVGRFAIVPRKGDEPCTVLIPLRPAEPALLEQQLASGQGILGPCAFVAAFGLPGAGLRSALDSMEWRTAAFATWPSAADGVDSLRPAWSELSAPAVRCLARSDHACGLAWGALSSQSRDGSEHSALPPDDTAVWDVVRLPWFTGGSAPLGAREGLLLSDLVRESDRARFGEAWRTSNSVDELVLRASGTRSGAWMSQWLAHGYRAPVVSPLPTAREFVWVALLGALAAIAIAATPRVRQRSAHHS